jgi:hypothetical protein
VIGPRLKTFEKTLEPKNLKKVLKRPQHTKTQNTKKKNNYIFLYNSPKNVFKEFVVTESQWKLSVCLRRKDHSIFDVKKFTKRFHSDEKKWQQESIDKKVILTNHSQEIFQLESIEKDKRQK